MLLIGLSYSLSSTLYNYDGQVLLSGYDENQTGISLDLTVCTVFILIWSYQLRTSTSQLIVIDLTKFETV